MKRNKMAVIGIGNRLLADEGAGLHAIDYLEEKFRDETIDVDLVEAGTPGMGLLHQFEEREKIIFIDAGDCELNPGEFRRFVPGEAISLKKTKDYSLHDFDLMGFLSFADDMDLVKNTEIVIYCIQAAEVLMSEKLSPVVEEKLSHLVQAVYDEVKQGGYHA